MTEITSYSYPDGDNTVLKAFYALYSGYEYPFASSDEILAKKDEGGRRFYFEQAKSLVESATLRQELTEWKRTLYAKLALVSMNDMERNGYRMTLLSIRDFEKRLQSLAQRADKAGHEGFADRL
jgi:hypothetical protein